MMHSVYAELRGFRARASHVRGATPSLRELARSSGYSVLVRCGRGQEFTRWVTPEDADEDLLRSALLAFEN